MKKLFTLLTLSILLASSGFSQKSYVNYNKDSRWFFGINAGATWHSRTEVNNIVKGGYGFTFGHSFGMRPEKLFSWDLRLRYLHGWWGGQATNQFTLDSTTSYPANYGSTLQTYQDTAGYFIPNFRSQLLSGSLELALNTNRLRENTGWNFQIFGGIGIKGYNSQADLLDANGQIYDYDNIGSTSQSNLLATQDGNYETDVTGSDSEFEVDWMPSFGAGISYQIAPWVSVGISHKMTWTRNDDKFDITPYTQAGAPSLKNDIYHYSSAGFKFHLFGGNHSTIIDEDPDEITDPNNFDSNNNNIITPVDNTPPRQKPIVDIYDPGASPYTTENGTFLLLANVYHVDGKANITFKQDGNINHNFTYNPATDKFQSNVVLHPGQNIFEITGVNTAGQDYESTIIIYEKEVPQIQPPIVTITNPPYSPYTTNTDVFNFAGTVLNVDSKSQIKVYFNGAYLSNFQYNLQSKNLYATLNLQEGTNTVLVTATNAAGSDSKTAKIIYKKPEVKQPPIVDYVFPTVDPFVTSQAALNITASVLNVETKNNITVTVNGVNTSNFSYNTNTKKVNFNVNLVEGANVLTVKGVNNVGQDYETTTIIYKRPETPKPPIVTFIDPNVDPITVYEPTYNLKVKVEHVDGASDITLKINGVQSYNFAYSTSSKIMTFTTGLNPGANVIEVTGTNDVGQDTENTTIKYRKVIPQAPPVVNITYPSTDNQVFNTPNINLIASVLNVNSANDITVLVNGNQTVNFTYNTATKILNLPLTMVEGANTVKITAVNSAGTDNDTRIIKYVIPQIPAPPTVDFVSPPSSPHLVTQEDFVMTANTTNINSKSQISLLFNGNLVQDAQYTLTANYQIIYAANLIEGNNIFEVVVTNNDGSDDEMAIVTYKKANEPCIIPTVGYIHPVPYSTVNEAAVTIDAQINNFTPGTTVQLLLNGVNQGFMTYNNGTSVASKAATLSEGSNAITVVVTNDCGTNQATFTLNYVAPEAPCNDPVLTAVGPINSTTQAESAAMSANASEIVNANQLSATVNGQTVPVTYDAGTHVVNVNNAPLSIGNNTIIITATNDCGTASLTYHVVREACNAPAITGGNISTMNNLNGETTIFTCTITNGTTSNIQFVVNGISQPFTYNDQTGVLTANVEFNVGDNAVSVLATNDCGSTSDNFTFNQEAPCEAIVVTTIDPTTNTISVTDEHYSIQLHASGTLASSGISANLNGAAVPFTYNQVTGEVSISNITLTDGQNTVLVSLTNDCSSEAVTYTINYDGCVPPTIQIPAINDGAVVNTSAMDFTAVIENSNGAGNIQLLVNGLATSFDYNELNSVLTATINLNEGTNSIQLTVNGCETLSENLTVTYEEPCEPITYSLMQPAQTAQTVVESTHAITLSVQHIENAQQISVSQNGSAINFTFDPNTHIVSINDITLADGANTITVNASNDCSSETITYSVQYNGCQAPVITLGTNPSTVTSELYSLSASVTNIANQNMLQVLLNGAPISFVYDAGTGTISAETNLIEGNNTFTITANGCESATENVSVNYTIPCNPVIYTLATPSQVETSVADAAFTITVFAQHASNVSVTLNGTAVTHTYDNDAVSANLTLADGDNTVVITLANDCSSETITYTIHHDNCDAPVISLGNNSATSSSANYTFTGTVSNIDNQNQLSVKLNENTVPFTFNAGTGEFVSTMTLIEGANNISIEANGCDAASANYNVNYTIPCLPVTYSLVSPANLTNVVNTATTTISLNVTNVEAQGDITVQANGSSVPFTYLNGLITITNLNLVEGTNNVIVSFGNDCSSESITYVIEADLCPNSPLITVTNNNIVTNDQQYTFTCNVQFVDNANNVSIALNGTSVPSTFDVGSGNLSATLALVEGANTVTVSATGCDATSVTYTVEYQQPCNPITFTHMIPQSNDTMHVNSSNVMVKINANHVEQSGVNATLNGNSVNFTYLSGSITVLNQGLQLGNNTLVIHMVNACSESDAIFHIVYAEDQPDCVPPVVNFNVADPVVNETAYTLNASITNADSSDITLKQNGQAISFNYNNDQLTAETTLIEGANNFIIEVHGCESVVTSTPVTYVVPCTPLTFSLVNPLAQTESVNTSPMSIELTTTEVEANGVSASLNGTTIAAVLNSQDGTVSLTGIDLTAGVNTILVNLSNDCSNQIVEYVITYDPTSDPNNQINANGPCGPRFNPGNSTDEFCLVTPNGTFNRDDLHNNANFTYSGPATAVYFKPIAGGGDAIVNGQAYTVSNGNYYLFEGNLTVDVSSSHPGSMGHWEICLNSDTAPTFGSGGNKPDSPCASSNDGGNGNGNGGGNGNGNGHSQQYLKPVFYPMTPGSSVANTSARTYTLKVRVENVAFQSDITVYLNGNSQRSWTFDDNKRVVTFNAQLKEGTNIIKIDAKNGPEFNTTTYKIVSAPSTNTTQVASAPIITNVNPSTTTGKSQIATYSFKAKVDHIRSKSDLKMYLNGMQLTTFSYSSSTKQVIAVLRLKEGKNVIKLVADNGSKTTERTYNVTYGKSTTTGNVGGGTTNTTAAKPVITNVSPSSTATSTTSANYTFKVKVSNVKVKSGVQLFVNGRNYTGFSFNSATGQVTAVIRLSSGTNVVKVVARNGNQTANRSYSINYKANTTTKPSNTGGTSNPTRPGGNTTTKPGGTTTKPSNTTKPGGTTTKPSTTTKPGGTTTKPAGTTTKPTEKNESGGTSRRG